MQCRKHDTANWFNITANNVQINYLYQQSCNSSNTTINNIFQEKRDANVVVVKDDEYLCYKSSSTYSYSKLSTFLGTTTGYLKLCPSGKYTLTM